MMYRRPCWWKGPLIAVVAILMAIVLGLGFGMLLGHLVQVLG